MTYKIITDSSCDIDFEFKKNHKLNIISMKSYIGEEVYEIGPCDEKNLRNFYEKMEEGFSPSTSQINENDYKKAFEKILKEGYDIVYLGLTASLSGSFNNAKMAREVLKKAYKDRRIELIDPIQASTGLGLIIESLEDMKDEGKSIDELVDFVDKNTKHLVTHFAVENLKYLYHGGRVSKNKAMVGDFLKVKPILHIKDDGSLDILKLERGSKRALKNLYKNFKKNFRSDISNKVLIGYAYSDENAKKLAELIKKDYKNIDLRLAPIGPIIGSHVGPGMYSISYFADKR